MPGEQAFPKCEHLRHRREFIALYQDGRKEVGRAFICYWTRRKGEGRKFGCAVSRKVGKAVVRNRVKRYLREIYRTHRAQLPDDIQMVIVARPISARLTYHETRDAVQRLFRQGGFLDG